MNLQGLGHFSGRAREAIAALLECFNVGEPSEAFARAVLMLPGLDEEVFDILGEVISRGNWRAQIIASVMLRCGIREFPDVAAAYSKVVAQADEAIVSNLKAAENPEAVQLVCQFMGVTGGTPPTAIPYLRQLMEESQPLMAAYAATALCWFDEEGLAARAKLGRLIRSDNVDAVLVAAPTMILHGDQAEVAMSVLEQALRKCDWRDRCMVVRLVESMGPPAKRTLPVWKEMLADESVPNFARALAASTIGSIGKGSSEGLDDLSAVLYNSDWHIVHGAANGLHLNGNVRLKDLRKLASLLKAENTDMRRVAILALKRFGPQAKPVLGDLLARLGNESDGVLAMAVGEAIATVGEEDAIEPLVEEIVRGDFRILPLATMGLTVLGYKAIPAVVRKLLRHPVEEVRLSGILIVQTMGSRAAPAVPALIEILHETFDVDIARAVIGTLAVCGRFAEPAIEEIILTLIGCPDVAVEEIAILALKKIGGNAIELMEEALPAVSGDARDRVERAITACRQQKAQPDEFKRFEQLDCDYLFRFFVLVGKAFVGYGEAKWEKIGKAIKPYVNFTRPNGKKMGTSPNAVRDSVKELADKLKVGPLTTHRPQVAGGLSDEGERLLVKAVNYVRAKYGHGAVPEINI